MRVLHVLDSLACGGVENTFVQMLGAFRKLGGADGESVEHDVLALMGGALEPDARAAARQVMVAASVSEAVAVLDADYDVVHLLTDRAAHALLPLIFSRSGSAVVYGKNYDLSAMYRLDGGFDWRADDCALSACDAVTFTTQPLADMFLLTEAPAQILGKAADVWRFARVPDPAPAAPDSVLCVANFHPRKRLQDLIAAFGRVRSLVPDARLRIVGSGSAEQADRLERAARDAGVQDRVAIMASFTAAVDQELAACRVFVLPSVSEGVPTVLLEAMAAGRPVVATRVGHVEQIIEHGCEGLLVPPRDIAALADAMVTVLGDRALAARMGAAGRHRSATHDVRDIARDLLQVLCNAARARRRAE